MILEILAGAKILSSIAQGIGSARQSRALAREGRRLAKDAINRGEEEVDRFETEVALMLGQVRSQVGAQMVDTDFGTAGVIQDQIEEHALEDVATIRLNAQREARGYRSQYGQASRQATTASVFSFLDAGVDAFSIWNANRSLKVPETRAPNVPAPTRESIRGLTSGYQIPRGGVTTAPAPRGLRRP